MRDDRELIRNVLRRIFKILRSNVKIKCKRLMLRMTGSGGKYGVWCMVVPQISPSLLRSGRDTAFCLDWSLKNLSDVVGVHSVMSLLMVWIYLLVCLSVCCSQARRFIQTT